MEQVRGEGAPGAGGEHPEAEEADEGDPVDEEEEEPERPGDLTDDLDSVFENANLQTDSATYKVFEVTANSDKIEQILQSSCDFEVDNLVACKPFAEWHCKRTVQPVAFNTPHIPILGLGGRQPADVLLPRREQQGQLQRPDLCLQEDQGR